MSAFLPSGIGASAQSLRHEVHTKTEVEVTTIEARNLLVEKYMPLVRKIARENHRNTSPCSEPSDLEQDLTVALIVELGRWKDTGKISRTAHLHRKLRDAAMRIRLRGKSLVFSGACARERKHWFGRVDWEKLHNDKGQPLI